MSGLASASPAPCFDAASSSPGLLVIAPVLGSSDSPSLVPDVGPATQPMPQREARTEAAKPILFDMAVSWQRVIARLDCPFSCSMPAPILAVRCVVSPIFPGKQDRCRLSGDKKSPPLRLAG